MIAEPWDIGPERLSGRQLPARLGGVERPLPRRRCAATGRATPALLPALSRGMLGSADLFEHQGRKPWASVNFVTAHDGFTLADLVRLQRQAQRGERRGQPRRPRRQPQLELRRRGADRRPGDPRPARPHAAQHDGDAAALAGHADDADGRRGRPHARAATTTPIARTTRSPGWSWNDARRRATAPSWSSCAASSRSARRYPLLRSAAFLHGQPIDGNGTRDVVWLRPDGAEMDDAALARPERQGRRAAAARPRRRRLLLLVNCLPRADRTSSCRPRLAATGSCASTPRPARSSRPTGSFGGAASADRAAGARRFCVAGGVG